MKSAEKEPVRFAVLAADTVVFTLRDGELLVRLIKVDRPPFFINTKGFPGGLLDPQENAEEAACRHVAAKTGIAIPKLYTEQLHTFSRVDRDPRGRVVAVGYVAFVPWDTLSPAEQTDTAESWWSRIKDARKLAYDHDEMLERALEYLRSRIINSTLIAKLMPESFTLTELEQAYAHILKTPLDKRNFRKKILKLNILKELPHKRTGGRFRPAQLYRFASHEVKEVGMI